jgi:hypothetical protein
MCETNVILLKLSENRFNYLCQQNVYIRIPNGLPPPKAIQPVMSVPIRRLKC